MFRYHGIEAVPPIAARTRVVAIGVFDGVHLGHQRILRGAVEAAQRDGGISAAVTFEPHPDSVLRPNAAPRLLTGLDRKAGLMEALGMDEILVVRFDPDFAGLSPEGFCKRVLSDRLGAGRVMVGENFRFGHGGQGTSADLQDYGKEHGFDVVAVPLALRGGEPISSTRIRALIGKGQVVEAADLLGRPHRLEGTVVQGVGRGRGLGAPTANLAVDRRLALPRLGIYITRVLLPDGRLSPSVTSVGTNPTFESGRQIHIETLLLDYEGDLYGKPMALDFLDRIRDQERFPDAAALAARIRKDVAIARGYFDVRSGLVSA
jgi:riboflavin kinase/FMN adenylyltransferase